MKDADQNLPILIEEADAPFEYNGASLKVFVCMKTKMFSAATFTAYRFQVWSRIEGEQH
jgi:hypothetical protein